MGVVLEFSKWRIRRIGPIAAVAGAVAIGGLPGCQVEGKGTMALGNQYPVAIQTEVRIIRTEEL